MQALERRISVLEQHVPTNFNKVMVIVFDTPGMPDTDIHKLRSVVFGAEKVEQHWVREVDESEREFRHRAEREVVRSVYGTALLTKVD